MMIPCTPGKICDGTKLATPSGTCPKGYYCEAGSSSSNANKKQCPEGYYCIAGSAEPIPCPAGTYSNSKRNEKEDDCQPCPATYYCDLIAQTNYDISKRCDPGFTCAQKSVQPRVTICPKGSYCRGTDVSPIACNPDIGEY